MNAQFVHTTFENAPLNAFQHHAFSNVLPTREAYHRQIPMISLSNLYVIIDFVEISQFHAKLFNKCSTSGMHESKHAPKQRNCLQLRMHETDRSFTLRKHTQFGMRDITRKQRSLAQ